MLTLRSLETPKPHYTIWCKVLKDHQRKHWKRVQTICMPTQKCTLLVSLSSENRKVKLAVEAVLRKEDELFKWRERLERTREREREYVDIETNGISMVWHNWMRRMGS